MAAAILGSTAQSLIQEFDCEANNNGQGTGGDDGGKDAYENPPPPPPSDDMLSDEDNEEDGEEEEREIFLKDHLSHHNDSGIGDNLNFNDANGIHNRQHGDNDGGNDETWDDMFSDEDNEEGGEEEEEDIFLEDHLNHHNDSGPGNNFNCNDANGIHNRQHGDNDGGNDENCSEGYGKNHAPDVALDASVNDTLNTDLDDTVFGGLSCGEETFQVLMEAEARLVARPPSEVKGNPARAGSLHLQGRMGQRITADGYENSRENDEDNSPILSNSTQQPNQRKADRPYENQEGEGISEEDGHGNRNDGKDFSYDDSYDDGLSAGFSAGTGVASLMRGPIMAAKSARRATADGNNSNAVDVVDVRGDAVTEGEWYASIMSSSADGMDSASGPCNAGGTDCFVMHDGGFGGGAGGDGGAPSKAGSEFPTADHGPTGNQMMLNLTPSVVREGFILSARKQEQKPPSAAGTGYIADANGTAAETDGAATPLAARGELLTSAQVVRPIQPGSAHLSRQSFHKPSGRRPFPLESNQNHGGGTDGHTPSAARVRFLASPQESVSTIGGCPPSEGYPVVQSSAAATSFHLAGEGEAKKSQRRMHRHQKQQPGLATERRPVVSPQDPIAPLHSGDGFGGSSSGGGSTGSMSSLQLSAHQQTGKNSPLSMAKFPSEMPRSGSSGEENGHVAASCRNFCTNMEEINQFATENTSANQNVPSVESLISLGERQMEMAAAAAAGTAGRCDTSTPGLPPRRPFLRKGARKEPSSLHRMNPNPTFTAGTKQRSNDSDHTRTPSNSVAGSTPNGNGGSSNINAHALNGETLSERKARVARLEKMQEDLLEDFERRQARKEEAQRNRKLKMKERQQGKQTKQTKQRSSNNVDITESVLKKRVVNGVGVVELTPSQIRDGLMNEQTRGSSAAKKYSAAKKTSAEGEAPSLASRNGSEQTPTQARAHSVIRKKPSAKNGASESIITPSQARANFRVENEIAHGDDDRSSLDEHERNLDDYGSNDMTDAFDEGKEENGEDENVEHQVEAKQERQNPHLPNKKGSRWLESAPRPRTMPAPPPARRGSSEQTPTQVRARSVIRKRPSAKKEASKTIVTPSQARATFRVENDFAHDDDDDISLDERECKLDEYGSDDVTDAFDKGKEENGEDENVEHQVEANQERQNPNLPNKKEPRRFGSTPRPRRTSARPRSTSAARCRKNGGAGRSKKTPKRSSDDVDEGERALEEWKKKEEEQWALIKNMRRRQEAALREAEGERERAKAWASAERESVRKWANEQRALIKKDRHKAANAALIASKNLSRETRQHGENGAADEHEAVSRQAMVTELKELRSAMKKMRLAAEEETKRLKETIRRQGRTIDMLKSAQGESGGGGGKMVPGRKKDGLRASGGSGGPGPRQALGDCSSKQNSREQWQWQQQQQPASKALRRKSSEHDFVPIEKESEIVEEHSVPIAAEKEDEEESDANALMQEPTEHWLQRHLTKLKSANNRLGAKIMDEKHHGSVRERDHCGRQDQRKPYNASDYGGATTDGGYESPTESQDRPDYSGSIPQVGGALSQSSCHGAAGFRDCGSSPQHDSHDHRQQQPTTPPKSQIFKYKNGAQREVLQDGTTTISFANGDRRRTYANEKKGVVVYYYAATKTTQVTHQDGTQTYHFPNKQIENHHADGRKEIVYPDGTTRTVHTDGSCDTTFADGTRVIDYPDGTQRVMQA